MSGLKKLGLNMLNAGKGAQKAATPFAASHQPVAAQAPKADGLSQFKAALNSGSFKPNQPALPYTASKSWVG